MCCCRGGGDGVWGSTRAGGHRSTIIDPTCVRTRQIKYTTYAGAVCMEAHAVGAKALKLPCQHCFHKCVGVLSDDAWRRARGATAVRVVIRSWWMDQLIYPSCSSTIDTSYIGPVSSRGWRSTTPAPPAASRCVEIPWDCIVYIHSSTDRRKDGPVDSGGTRMCVCPPATTKPLPHIPRPHTIPPPTKYTTNSWRRTTATTSGSGASG